MNNMLMDKNTYDKWQELLDKEEQDEKDKEIERLNKRIEELENEPLTNKISRIDSVVANIYREDKEKDKEIERLNNIINELEKYIKESCWKDDWGVETIYVKMLLNKLQELKGEIK